MTAPVRVTKAEIESAIKAAKEAGAVRVTFDGGRIVVDLQELDETELKSQPDPQGAWDDAA